MEKPPRKPDKGVCRTDKGTGKPAGRFLLVRHGVVEGVFDSFYAACQHGLAKYNPAEFLVRREGEE